MKERNELHVVLVHFFFDASDVISKHEIVLEHVIFFTLASHPARKEHSITGSRASQRHLSLSRHLKQQQ